MIKLPSIFSNGALYQQKSNLDIHGSSVANSKIIAKLLGLNGVFSEISVNSDENGGFMLTLKTPPASFDKYFITISDLNSGDELKIENILFGELWLASGQSNMEMTNASMYEREELLASIKNYNIRCYKQQPLGEGGGFGPFPFDPSNQLPGIWCEAGDIENMVYISAAATSFAKILYEKINIPIGILNSSMGATGIECWLPKEDVMENEKIYNVLKEQNRLPVKERWDSYGEWNFLQPCALFNQKIYPLIGVKTRGVIWYQGESNVSAYLKETHYINCLKRYQETYEKLFKSENEETFPMISSLLYPWSYGESGECNMSYINKAFTDTADNYPDKFAVAAIYDLPPIWSYFENNHPIHPANKYQVGDRLGLLAMNNCYGRSGQKSSPVFSNMEKCDDKLIITFKNVGEGLHCKDKDKDKIKGFYICGENNLYINADAKIIQKDKVAVFNKHLSKPLNAAYQYSSLENDGNLFGGELPVAPFATDNENIIKIELKPWLDLTKQAVWVFNCHEDINDMFYRPIWHPAKESEICYDDAFSETGKSLRILGDGQVIGAYVKSYNYNALDLQNYKALHFDIFNHRNVKCFAELNIKVSPSEKQIIKLDGEKLADKNNGWAEFAVT
ncbi:MAG: sialate O-acetylesterase, partial [Clostridia bacterium]|nr:sialate O-acetylesterase [Clostridia bacterium]